MTFATKGSFMPIGILSRISRDERGVVSVIFAMALIVILGAAGMAIDYSRSEHVKSELQTLVDAAVLAGAVAEPGQETAVAERYLAAAGLPGLKPSFGISASGEVTGHVETLRQEQPHAATWDQRV